MIQSMVSQRSSEIRFPLPQQFSSDLALSKWQAWLCAVLCPNNCILFQEAHLKSRCRPGPTRWT